MNISENIEKIQEKMEAACRRSARDVSSVRLMAVTKTHTAEEIFPAYEFGLRCFGENRVMELKEKAPLLPSDVEWHLIGHLQHNKVKPAVRLAAWIHSVDSLDLLEKINREAEIAGTSPKLLLEVNISGEESKFGLRPDEVAAVLQASRGGCCKVVGLMTMAPLMASDDELHRVFAGLRNLRDSLQEATGMDLPELSMGMSGDFEVAIEEGATIVRVGSAIFGERHYA